MQGIVFRLQVTVVRKIALFLDNLDGQIRQIEALGADWDDLKARLSCLKNCLKTCFIFTVRIAAA
jgi:hypothetical protein